jgi:hypothetical protein
MASKGKTSRPCLRYVMEMTKSGVVPVILLPLPCSLPVGAEEPGGAPAGPRVQTRESQAAMTPATALGELKTGNARFVSNAPKRRDWSAKVVATASGQYPFAAVLGCMDSRAPVEVDAASIVPGADRVTLLASRIRPLRQAPLADAREDLVELDLAHEERIVLGEDLARASVLADVHVVEAGVADPDHRERTEDDRRRQAEHPLTVRTVEVERRRCLTCLSSAGGMHAGHSSGSAGCSAARVRK